MNTMIPSNTNPEKSDKVVSTRPVTIVIAEPHDGRLPVTITVVPVADLDAQGGVFVDFRTGTKEAVEVVADAAATTRIDDAAAALVSEIAKGDEAVAGMVKAEAAAERSAAKADETLHAGPAGKDAATGPKEAKQKKPPQEAKPPLMSHQIAEGLKLTVGQAETFRADVAMPQPSPGGEGWYIRGRFQTVDGRDLKSSWQRV